MHKHAAATFRERGVGTNRILWRLIRQRFSFRAAHARHHLVSMFIYNTQHLLNIGFFNLSNLLSVSALRRAQLLDTRFFNQMTSYLPLLPYWA